MRSDRIERIISLLTMSASCANLILTIENKANRMKCANTSHGSNPTLVLAVRGLRSIVYHLWTFVLRASSGSADSAVGMSRFVFRVVRGMYA